MHLLNKSCLCSKSDTSPSEAKLSRGMHQRREIPRSFIPDTSNEIRKCWTWRGGVKKTEPRVPFKVSFSVSHFLCVRVCRSASACLSPIVHLAWSWLKRNGFDLLSWCRPLLFTIVMANPTETCEMWGLACYSLGSKWKSLLLLCWITQGSTFLSTPLHQIRNCPALSCQDASRFFCCCGSNQDHDCRLIGSSREHRSKPRARPGHQHFRNRNHNEHVGIDQNQAAPTLLKKHSTRL